MNKKNKILVILGPTASGKSDIAIKLAKKFNGEIISADSRQIYKGMDLGSGKVPRDSKQMLNSKVYRSANIPHYMIDIISPKNYYNVSKFKKKVDKIIPNILKQEKVPIICGGTGFWIKSIIDNMSFPKVKPNWKLRKKLTNQPTSKLLKILKKMDSERAKNIDKYNKTRIIRAIEICQALGKVPKLIRNSQSTNYIFFQIGIDISKEKLHQNIQKRLKKRFRQGMLAEVKKLHQQGVSWKRLESFGLEYRWIAKYLQNKISRKEMQAKLLQDIKNYAKRQITWFKKDKRIYWLKQFSEINKHVALFLKIEVS